MNNFEKFKEFPLTYGLIIINVVIFIIPQIFTALYEPIYQAYALNDYWTIFKGESYRFVTSIFLHFDGMHILMNMLSLYMVGRMVEKLFSTTAYLSIYFVTAFFGAMLSLYVHPNSWGVGASGAIFGLFGALVGFAFFHRKRMRQQFMAFMKDFGIILLINLAIGFIFPSIDVAAHVGGLLSGMVLGYLIAKNFKLLWLYMLGSLGMLVGCHLYLEGLFSSYAM